MRLTDSCNIRTSIADYDTIVDCYDGILLIQMCQKLGGEKVEITKCMEVGLEYRSDPENAFCINDVNVVKGSRILLKIYYSDKSEMHMSPRFMHILCIKQMNQIMFEMDLKQYIMIYCSVIKEVSRARITGAKIIDYGKR